MKLFSVEQHQRRRRLLWFSTGTTCRPSNSSVLRWIQLWHGRQRRRDSRCAAEHGPAADARDALCTLAGTNQSGVVHVGRRSSAVPSFRSQFQSSHVSKKHRLSHRLQRWCKCQPVGCLRVTCKFRHQWHLFTSKLRLFSVIFFYLATFIQHHWVATKVASTAAGQWYSKIRGKVCLASSFNNRWLFFISAHQVIACLMFKCLQYQMCTWAVSERSFHAYNSAPWISIY